MAASAKKTSSRDVSESKSKQSSLYRKIEKLTAYLIGRTSNVPNVPMIRTLTERLATELIDCLAATGYAYSVPELDMKYKYLEEMDVHLTVILSIIKLIAELPQTLPSCKIMTLEQEANYIMVIDEINRERDNWMKSIQKKMNVDTPFSNLDNGNF